MVSPKKKKKVNEIEEEAFRESYILKCASIIKRGTYSETLRILGHLFEIRSFDIDEYRVIEDNDVQLAFNSLIKVGNWNVVDLNYEQKNKLYSFLEKRKHVTFAINSFQYLVQATYVYLLASVHSFVITLNSKFLWGWWRNTSNHPKIITDYLVLWGFYNSRMDEDKIFECFKFIGSGFSEKVAKIKTTFSHEGHFFKSIFKEDREKSIRQLEEEGEFWNRGEIKDEHDAVIKSYEDSLEKHKDMIDEKSKQIKKRAIWRKSNPRNEVLIYAR